MKLVLVMINISFFIHNLLFLFNLKKNIINKLTDD